MKIKGELAESNKFFAAIFVVLFALLFFLFDIVLAQTAYLQYSQIYYIIANHLIVIYARIVHVWQCYNQYVRVSKSISVVVIPNKTINNAHCVTVYSLCLMNAIKPSWATYRLRCRETIGEATKKSYCQKDQPLPQNIHLAFEYCNQFTNINHNAI